MGLGNRLSKAYLGVTLVAAVAIVALPPFDKAAGAAGGKDRNLDVCITLDDWGSITSDGRGPYCASERGIKAFVGSNRSITFTISEKSSKTRRLHLTLGDRLPDIEGDPPPPADWSNHEPPVIPEEEGLAADFEIAYRVKVLRMGEPGEEPNPLWRNARFIWEDERGTWRLYWGHHLQPGGWQATNPNAPDVMVTRRVDSGGNLINEWDVTTEPDTEREGAATAFLYHEPGPGGDTGGYWGAFDVSFQLEAVEEP